MAKSSRGKRQKKPVADSKGTGSAEGSAESNTPQAPDENKSFLQKLASAMGHKNLDEMTIGEIFKKHPLINVGKFIFIPYLLYHAWFYLQLQHPEYISKMTGGIINLRPAVYGTDTPRQVLIVATPGSGTVQMASELSSKLSLEIGHESSDAAWDFTRDGSVSWFHGIRFLTEPKDNNERITALAKICNSDIETHKNMGFHPAMYGPPRNKCSYRSKWDDCWKSECYVTLLQEWGCGIEGTCEIEFAKNIHQVRNPMKTLESLVVKYCIGGINGLVAEPFVTYASALFPSHDFTGDSCIEATGTFMVMYLEAMVEARSKGHIDAFYRIETSSACDVAQSAGLMSPDTTVYQPNHKKVSDECNKNNTKSPAQKVVEKKLNKVNKERVRLGWNDLRGGMNGSRRKDGDLELEGRMKKLFRAFGYHDSTVPLEYAKKASQNEL